MYHACKTGNQHLIRLFVSYDTNVSCILIGRGNNVLPLHLAAEKGQVEVFELLLDLGAGIYWDYTGHKQLGKFIRLLGAHSPVANDLLRHFIQAGLAAQVLDRPLPAGRWPSDPNLYLSVVSRIHSGAPLDIVRSLLHSGAAVNRLWSTGNHILASPLSAAIMSNSVPIFELLLERGADVRGTDVYFYHRRKHGCYTFTKPLHIPIFAAASAMPKHDIAMMQSCLDMDADINRASYTYNLPSHAIDEKSQFYNYTPLLIYLDSIDSWESDASLRPMDGLKCFLENHAITVPTNVRRSRSTLQVLLDKWHVNKLSNPEFFTTIQCLVENVATKDRSLLTLQYITSISGKGISSSEELPPEYKNFADLVLDHDPSAAETKKTLLSHLTVDRDDRDFMNVERAMIDYLLKSGVDINMPCSYRGPPLHIACMQVHESIDPRMRSFDCHSSMAHSKFRHISDHAENEVLSCGHVRRKIAFLTFLVEKGADPNAVFQDGTAMDILMAKIDVVSQSAKIYLLALAATLRGDLGRHLCQGFRSGDPFCELHHFINMYNYFHKTRISLRFFFLLVINLFTQVVIVLELAFVPSQSG
jgi:ankyrin repeat protein